MMGRNHALSGAVAGMAVATPLHLYGTGPLYLDTTETWLFVATTAGAAVLPDIDHCDSTVSEVLGWFTAGFAWLVQRAAGGHRHGTHSWVGCAVFSILAFAFAALYTASWVLFGYGAAVAAGMTLLGYLRGRTDPNPRPVYKRPWQGRAATTVVLGVATAIAVCAALWPARTGAVGGGLLIGLVWAAAIRVMRIDGIWDDLLPIPALVWVYLSGVDVSALPWAVALGVVVHLRGDDITVQGCPYGWPWSQRMTGLKLMKTNGVGERRVGAVLWVAAAGLLAWYAGLYPALLGWLGAAARWAGLA